MGRGARDAPGSCVFLRSGDLDRDQPGRRGWRPVRHAMPAGMPASWRSWPRHL